MRRGEEWQHGLNLGSDSYKVEAPVRIGVLPRRHGVTRSSIDVLRTSGAGSTPADGIAAVVQRKPCLVLGEGIPVRIRAAASRHGCEGRTYGPPNRKTPFDSGMPHGRTVGGRYFERKIGGSIPPTPSHRTGCSVVVSHSPKCSRRSFVAQRRVSPVSSAFARRPID